MIITDTSPRASINDGRVSSSEEDSVITIPESILPIAPAVDSPEMTDSSQANTTDSSEAPIPEDLVILRARGMWDIFLHHSFIVENETTEARDLCQAERNAMAWLRACTNLGFVGGALLLNLRFSSLQDKDGEGGSPNEIYIFDDSKLGKNVSFVLGLIFFGWSISGTILAFLNYVYVVSGYIKKLSEVRNTRLSYVFGVIIAVTALFTNIFYLAYYDRS